ncbi:MAG: WhiB family transcriptional regulator [Candidatus Dormibacteraeota bacterium]|nr:WhiB family transcriptional regulator [Candidatus Dormibacteraeota bacterium]
MHIATILASADERWHPLASCIRTGPDRYFGTRRSPTQCASCPASEPCLWAGLALEQYLGQRYGTWGGTSAARRDRIAASLPPATDLISWYLGVVDEWLTRTRPQLRERPAG